MSSHNFKCNPPMACSCHVDMTWRHGVRGGWNGIQPCHIDMM